MAAESHGVVVFKPVAELSDGHVISGLGDALKHLRAGKDFVYLVVIAGAFPAATAKAAG